MVTKLILECGCNHQGNINIAKEMIKQAYELGAYGVKFQKRDIDNMCEGWKLVQRSLDNSFGKNYYDHRKALELSIESLQILSDYAHSMNLVFGVTAFDVQSAKDLLNVNIDFIKIPSQHFSHYGLVRYLLDSGVEIYASTGMHTVNEVIDWQYFNDYDVVYYCKSVYPCQLQDLNLSNMSRIADRLNPTQSLGYSSHEINGYGIPMAIILGARYIERHFTLDKTMKGSDHKTVSSDPKEIKEIIESIEYSEMIMGESNDLTAAEKKTRKIYRGF